MSGWWKTAKPGDRVVCVDAYQPVLESDLPGISVGKIYTISAVIFERAIGCDGRAGRHVSFRLCEARNSLSTFDDFDARRFRPVQTKSTETGMAILKRILNGAPVREDA